MRSFFYIKNSSRNDGFKETMQMSPNLSQKKTFANFYIQINSEDLSTFYSRTDKKRSWFFPCASPSISEFSR